MSDFEVEQRHDGLERCGCGALTDEVPCPECASKEALLTEAFLLCLLSEVDYARELLRVRGYDPDDVDAAEYDIESRTLSVRLRPSAQRVHISLRTSA